MITYTTGNLLEADTEALVNTVNTVGVMGKGIALQFKETFPHNFKVYKQACKDGSLTVGTLLIVKECLLQGDKIIINFPTKKDWKQRSAYEYIESGLQALVKELNKGTIKSLSIPPLGCGNGGLDWAKVKPMMEQYLTDIPVDIHIYEPNEAIKSQLQKAESVQKQPQLTAKRAMLLYALYCYDLSMGENPNLFVANKLAYFLQRLGEPLRLNFQKGFYGPYSPQVGHVLYPFNGHYLKGMEQFETQPFEPLFLNYAAYPSLKQYIQETLSLEQQTHLKSLQELMRGFESFLALEVLATVDFIRKDNPSFSVSELLKAIAEWSPRKARDMKEIYVVKALERLKIYEISVV